jgi:hypothetical protein
MANTLELTSSGIADFDDWQKVVESFTATTKFVYLAHGATYTFAPDA